MPWRYVYNYIRRSKNYVYIINNLYFLVSGKLLESHLFINEYSLSLYVFNMDFSDIYSFSVPVLTYLNTDTDKMSIIKDNTGKSGVYILTNLENGKRYVGGYVNLSVRLAQYYNINILTKYRSLIHKALLKYCYSKFKLEILEYCLRKDIIKREQYYIDTLKP